MFGVPSDERRGIENATVGWNPSSGIGSWSGEPMKAMVAASLSSLDRCAYKRLCCGCIVAGLALMIGCSRCPPHADEAATGEPTMAGAKSNRVSEVYSGLDGGTDSWRTPKEYEQWVRRLPEAEFTTDASAMGISVDEARSIAIRTYREYAGLSSLPESKQRIARIALMRRACQALSSTGGQVAGESLVAKGLKLPDSFVDMFFSKQSDPETMPEVQMQKAGFLGVPRELLYEQHVVFASTVGLFPVAPDMVVGLVKERGNTLPPTVADYILYRSIQLAVADDVSLRNRKSISGRAPTPPYAAGLLELATAANPIYRLLAVDLVSSVEGDLNKQIAFFAGYINETDPRIRNTVIERLQSLEMPEADKVLRAFQTKRR